MLLELQGVTVSYDGIRAIRDVTFGVQVGELLALIGPNGAGKTTTLRAITGLAPRHGGAGTILFKGMPINGLPPHRIARRGVVMAPEGRQIFGLLTVAENLKLATFARPRTAASTVQGDLAYVFTLFPILRERMDQPAGTLSGGEQQMLCIGRSLMARPDLLLLDEPSLGLAPMVVGEIFQVIKHLHQNGTTILLVEQNARMALQVADRALVLENGGIALTGTAQDLLNDDRVRGHYLGERVAR